MFPKIVQWLAMAEDSPRYGHDPRAEGMRERVLAAGEWENLSVEDRAFLTACIRDVEDGNRLSGTTHHLGDWAEAERRADAAEASGQPDISGPTGVWSMAPDATQPPYEA